MLFIRLRFLQFSSAGTVIAAQSFSVWTLRGDENLQPHFTAFHLVQLEA